MAKGDHIYVRRWFYTHHGIDAGDGTVIHYSSDSLNKSGAVIERTSLEDFRAGDKLAVRRYPECLPADLTVERATQRLGEAQYRLVFNNCEHFASWCRTGIHSSSQVRRLISGVAGFALHTLVLRIALPLVKRIR